ncbi:site-specific integrase [Leadbettera azotonutricia]|uniref:Site-specific recombinase, phage integrase family n=1 Tax=Leadbettera azotonutricia (strain ATCC BAA-888 / DSM 13862 / ZAS-9) TaxID=545695 RepID=F5YBJ4_LEAAZ|nr:site-specific integrase [Leadbettera azotonutricia]AEF80237.1 site-specific recombinase, phage integrase family [Leadbettera azotonutricia ZAS-9]
MGVKIREIRGKLYLDIYDKGQRHAEALHLSVSKDPAMNKENMRRAEYARARREQQLFDGSWNLQDTLSAKKSLYRYIEEMAKGRDARKDRVCKCLPYLKKYPGGDLIQLGQVNSKWFNNFQDWMLKESGLGEQSANSYVLGVRMALGQAVRENILTADPAEGIKAISIPEPDMVTLTLGELKKMAGVPIGGKLGAEVQKGFIFACYCGLRISDIKTLIWGDIEHDTDGARLAKKQVKTKKRVFIPLHASAWGIINDGKLHNKGEPLFPLLAGSSTETNRYLKQWAAKAGIQKNIGWHTARRSCATILHSLGVDIYTIQKILGHGKIATTAIYTQVSDKEKRTGIDKMPEIKLAVGIEGKKELAFPKNEDKGTAQ